MHRILTALTALTVLLAGVAACSDDGPEATAATTAGGADGQGPAEDVAGPEVGEHWHVAYAVQVCGAILRPLTDRGPDALGIHTHEDGLIHVHPFLAAAAGKDATLKAFLDQVGLDVGDDGVDLPEHVTQAESGNPPEDCSGPDDVVRVAQWDDALAAAEGAEPDRIVTDDLDDVVLGPDLSALTIVVGPADDPVQAPPAAIDICQLAVVDGPLEDVGGEGSAGGPCAGVDPNGGLPSQEEDAGSAAGLPCVGETVDPGSGAPEVEVPAGPPPTELVVEDLVVGDGDVAAEGDAVTVDYVGIACSTGEVFDSSYEAGRPATFDLIPGSLIEGFATGVEGLAVGGRRRVVIPSEQAYGSEGQGPIAPDEALVFVIELVAVS